MNGKLQKRTAAGFFFRGGRGNLCAEDNAVDMAKVGTQQSNSR